LLRLRQLASRFAGYPRGSRSRAFAIFFSWRAVVPRLRDEGCFLAAARRSIFFRRTIRFLTLSLPRLCPITVNTRGCCN
jgi:hypothetical protein